MVLSSVSGFLSLLNDNNAEIQSYALQRLLDSVDVFWPEISDAVNKIEVLFESKRSKLAALLVSKVYYHLSGFQESLNYALYAEELFDLNTPSDFVETIVAKCIDRYIEMRSTITDAALANGDQTDRQLYSRLEQVVQRMFDRSLQMKEYKHSLGIAIETRRLDMVKRILDDASSTESHDLLRMAYRISLSTITEVGYRKQLLRLLARQYVSQKSTVDVLDMFNCLIALDDPQGCALLFESLLRAGGKHLVIVYQAAFDMLELGNQGFTSRILSSLYQCPGIASLYSAEEKVELFQQCISTGSGSVPTQRIPPAAAVIASSDVPSSTPMEEDPTAAPAANPVVVSSSADGAADFLLLVGASALMEFVENQEDCLLLVPGVPSLTGTPEELKTRVASLTHILNGDKNTELFMQFLIRNNNTDMRLMDRLKSEVRQSITHNATVIANGFMHYGTTSDQFLRDNLEWLARAVNWAKFSATATLGIIHKGHEKDSLKLMEAYLPKDQSGGGSPYTEGGGLYALGLMHAGHGRNIRSYLLQQVKEAQTEQVRHGGLLGLGLACMSTDDEECFNTMQDMLNHDDAVIGEAAGYGIGLVGMGSLNDNMFKILTGYAQETKHDKIIRSCAMAAALLCFHQQTAADEHIAQLCAASSPAMRAGGAAAIGMAYCGTSNAIAVKKLLHLAVSDTSDDAKRWAVTSLGFVLCNAPERLPAVVSLLAESYNPHLRYGTAMAMGIACAGTGMKEAIHLLEPLLEDRTHYVRQGAFVAMAMVTMQHNAITCSKSVELRDKLLKVIGDKHDDIMAKFGAMIALGIQNAGGRNVTISLQNRTGGINWMSAAGLLLFQNYWHWYPLCHLLSLSFVSTSVMVLNKDLNMPKLTFTCACKPSTFAYVPPLQQESEKKKDKHETAVLSVTAKELRRAERKKGAQEKLRSKTERLSATSTTRVTPVEETTEKDETTTENPIPVEEPNVTVLSNPARVLPMQGKYMQLTDNVNSTTTGRYTPVRPLSTTGIILLHDQRPADEQELVENIAANRPQGSGGVSDVSEPEPEPPQAFQWTEEDDKEALKSWDSR